MPGARRFGVPLPLNRIRRSSRQSADSVPTKHKRDLYGHGNVSGSSTRHSSVGESVGRGPGCPGPEVIDTYGAPNPEGRKPKKSKITAEYRRALAYDIATPPTRSQQMSQVDESEEEIGAPAASSKDSPGKIARRQLRKTRSARMRATYPSRSTVQRIRRSKAVQVQIDEPETKMTSTGSQTEVSLHNSVPVTWHPHSPGMQSVVDMSKDETLSAVDRERDRDADEVPETTAEVEVVVDKQGNEYSINWGCKDSIDELERAERRRALGFSPNRERRSPGSEEHFFQRVSPKDLTERTLSAEGITQVLMMEDAEDEAKFQNFKSQVCKYNDWINDAYHEKYKITSTVKWQKIFGAKFGKSSLVNRKLSPTVYC